METYGGVNMIKLSKIVAVTFILAILCIVALSIHNKKIEDLNSYHAEKYNTLLEQHTAKLNMSIVLAYNYCSELKIAKGLKSNNSKLFVNNESICVFELFKHYTVDEVNFALDLKEIAERVTEVSNE